MATKGVIPSFQGCRRRQEKSKITDRCGYFGLLRSNDGVCQGTMTQVCWTRYSATTLANIGVFPGFARYTKRYRLLRLLQMEGGVAEQNRRAVETCTFRDTGGRDRLLTPALSPAATVRQRGESVEEERENPMADV